MLSGNDDQSRVDPSMSENKNTDIGTARNLLPKGHREGPRPWGAMR